MASKMCEKEPAVEKMVVDKEWLEAFAERKLPQVLKSVREKKPPTVADFIKLVQLEWKTNAVEEQPRPVEWMDWLDEEPEAERLM